ncbi:hypothetical protein [Aquimarina algiphila]|uniref:hypothetical protein n=1 Tax=Aquimarina algiphila TaxID=2047982 RepID=UPI00232B386C|nr:hypothetical protein [Aquimarina algiphila]
MDKVTVLNNRNQHIELTADQAETLLYFAETFFSVIDGQAHFFKIMLPFFESIYPDTDLFWVEHHAKKLHDLYNTNKGKTI